MTEKDTIWRRCHSLCDRWPAVAGESGWGRDAVSDGRIAFDVSGFVALALADAIGYGLCCELEADVGCAGAVPFAVSDDGTSGENSTGRTCQRGVVSDHRPP